MCAFVLDIVGWKDYINNQHVHTNITLTKKRSTGATLGLDKYSGKTYHVPCGSA